MRLLTGRGAELDIFELRFDGSAQQVNATLVGALNLKLLAATTCAQQMVHAALTTPYGQFEPELEAQFQQVVAPLVATSGALFMYECARVTNATRAAFEAGAAASAARAVDPAVAALLAFGINDAFDANSTTLQHANESQAYFLPLMHITPLSPTLTVFLMYDAVAPSNLFERRVAFEMAATTGMPAWSDILPNTAVNSAGMVVPSNLLVVAGQQRRRGHHRHLRAGVRLDERAAAGAPFLRHLCHCGAHLIQRPAGHLRAARRRGVRRRPRRHARRALR